MSCTNPDVNVKRLEAGDPLPEGSPVSDSLSGWSSAAALVWAGGSGCPFGSPSPTPTMNDVCELGFRSGSVLLSPVREELGSLLGVVARLGFVQSGLAPAACRSCGVSCWPPCRPRLQGRVSAVLQSPTFTGPDPPRTKRSHSLTFRNPGSPCTLFRSLRASQGGILTTKSCEFACPAISHVFLSKTSLFHAGAREEK